jgi:hypothetical protein
LRNSEIVAQIWNAFCSRTLDSAQAASILTGLAHTLTAGMNADYQASGFDTQTHLIRFVSLMLATLKPILSNDHLNDDNMKTFYDLFLTADNSFLSPGYQQRYSRAMNLTLPFRHIFITRKGHIGFDHSQLLTGDTVSMLYGAKLTFLLRNRENYWQFVGENYVYKVFDDVVHETWMKLGLEEQIFELR